MRIKSILRWALTLALALPITAMAETRLLSQEVVSGLVGLHPVNHSYVLRLDGEEQDRFAVFGRGGERLSGAYTQIDIRQDHPYYIISSGNEMNTRGLLDGNGVEVMKPLYGSITVVGDRWLLGSVLQDWSTIALTDVFFDGVKIGTLGPEEFTMASYAVAHGAYLGISTGQSGYYLSSRFDRIESTAEYFIGDEFYYDWQEGCVIHPASGQRAFTPGCTLTEDEVERTLWYTEAGDFINLQGDVVSSGPSVYKEYDAVEYEGGDYLRLRTSSGVGVADKRGVELIPALFSAVGGDTRSYFAAGYQAVLQEGQIAWIDRSGYVTAAATSVATAGDYQGFGVNGLFVVTKTTGETVVITAAAGALAQRYEDALAPISAQQRIATVKLDGLWGAIDLTGNVVIPFEHESPLQISGDGTLAIGQNLAHEQVVYTVAYGDEPLPTAEPSEAPAPTEEPTTAPTESPTPEPTQAPEAPAEEESWECPNCGRVNTLNFCPDDGTSRPVPPPACDSCGYVFEDGEVPKFCPYCGVKLS